MGGQTDNVEGLLKRFPHAHVINWTDHLSTIKRGMTKVKTRFAWVISSCCDYTNFDFNWEPTPWEEHQIHCWPSDAQSFGDTFLIPHGTWHEQIPYLKKLEDFRDVNYTHASVKRIPWEEVIYDNDSLASAIKGHRFSSPYALFRHLSCPAPLLSASLWKDRAIFSGGSNNATCLVSRDATIIKKQVYDYPFLETSMQPAEQLEIVYISNGETNAEINWWHLRKNTPPWIKVHRIMGVNGRAQAYKAAAEISTTSWFFAVFAKLEVDKEFDWDWQPDYWQEPKHYIFHAKNPVNGLTYGHQAIIAYNKKLVLENTATGLDFTLDQLHEVVPVLSGIAHYNVDPWTTWRTAFREAIKLKHSLPNIENEYRLSKWLLPSKELNGEWSMYGAMDGIEYYQSVNGNFDDLKKTYEWGWLRDYFLAKYPST